MRTRKYFKFIAGMVACTSCLVLPGFSQDRQQNCSGVSSFPSNVAAFMYLEQPGISVKLGKGQLLIDAGRKQSPVVTVRNETGKTIRRLSISEWRLGGGSSEWLPLTLASGLAPGRSIEIGRPNCKEFPEFTMSEMKAMGLSTETLVTVIVLGVREVRFADGSMASDSDITKRFDEFARRLNLDKP